jgi:hypothetical protein
MVSKSVQIGDITPELKDDTIRQIIRNEYLRDSTVCMNALLSGEGLEPNAEK